MIGTITMSGTAGVAARRKPRLQRWEVLPRPSSLGPSGGMEYLVTNENARLCTAFESLKEELDANAAGRIVDDANLTSIAAGIRKGERDAAFSLRVELEKAGLNSLVRTQAELPVEPLDDKGEARRSAFELLAGVHDSIEIPFTRSFERAAGWCVAALRNARDDRHLGEFEKAISDSGLSPREVEILNDQSVASDVRSFISEMIARIANRSDADRDRVRGAAAVGYRPASDLPRIDREKPNSAPKLVAMAQLGRAEAKVLAALQKSSTLMGTVDIAAAAEVSETTAKKAVLVLIGLGLAHRPDGERSGTGVTESGKAFELPGKDGELRDK